MTQTTKRRKWTKKELRQLKEMYAAGVSINELCRIFDRTKSAIYKKCYMMDYERPHHVFGHKADVNLPAVVQKETVYKGEVIQKQAPSWFKKMLGNVIGVQWSKETKTINTGRLPN